MTAHFEPDETVIVNLRRDEAIVLYTFLSREVWQNDQAGLRAMYRNEAESHCLQALLQELVPRLVDAGGPDSDSIYAAAVESLIAKHS